MRILVTGAGGLLGLNLSLAAISEHDVTGVDRNQLAGTPFRFLNADLLEPGALEATLDDTQPDWLIHCAALADVDACEADPELSLRLNAGLPDALAQTCARRSIRLVHISTDAVLDGSRREPYTEQDTPNPLGVYAQTKLEGERRVLQANPNAIVARVNFFRLADIAHGLFKAILFCVRLPECSYGFLDPGVEISRIINQDQVSISEGFYIIALLQRIHAAFPIMFNFSFPFTVIIGNQRRRG